MTTPFWDQRFAAGSFYTGWYGAWEPAASAYAIAAESAADIQAAVRFAGKHNLRLAVKGTGSDYLGRSSAAGSLLVWTHRMQGITWSDDDLQVTVEAGVRWGDVYLEAQARGRFVAGGQCPNVGAGGGYALGGGWSPFSRLFGTIAHSLLEATVVTADGAEVIANSTHHSDLFWALRGGGGGTFGIAVRLVFRTWPAPAQVGYLIGGVSCPNEGSLRRVTEAFIALYPRLAPEQWSDKVWFEPHSLRFMMLFPGLTAESVKAAFTPFLEALGKSACRNNPGLVFDNMPADHLPSGAQVARVFPYPWASENAPGVDDHWYMPADAHQYYAYYVTRYIPSAEFERPAALAAKLMSLVRHRGLQRGAGVLLQFNKALGGTTVPREDIPAPHPSAYNAAAFLDLGWTALNYFPQLPATQDTLAAVRDSIKADCNETVDADMRCLAANRTDGEARACFAAFRRCIVGAARDGSDIIDRVHDFWPDTGTYVNEANFFEVNWQDTFWGRHYARLRKIKAAVDPSGLFVCHHCVGSEDWSTDGNCRLAHPTVFV